ncbi:hypothetical protein [Tenacibaculum sp. 190524A02b]
MRNNIVTSVINEGITAIAVLLYLTGMYMPKAQVSTVLVKA